MISSRAGCGIVAALGVQLATGCVQIRVPDPDAIYVAFGDSTTRGPSPRDYPDILREKLGAPVESMANEGDSGETASEGVDRLRAILADEIFPNAEYLLYWEGGNDITDFIKDVDRLLLLSPDAEDYPFDTQLDAKLDAIAASIRAAIRAGQDAGLRVHVATYYFLRESVGDCPALFLDIVLPSQAEHANAYINRLNARIREVVADTGATLVDVADEDQRLRGDPANYFNCNHLSEQGNDIVATLFAGSIEAG
jgi:lysophospholipase L1-like esterase